MSSTESQENAPLVRWPSAEWQTEFHKQFTKTVLDAATASAAIEIARFRHQDVSLDLTAEDLVQDILTATLDGTLTWRPESVSLATHVKDVIGYRCRQLYRQIRRAVPAPEIALDALDEDDGLWTDVEDALGTALTETDAGLADLARRLVDEIVHLRNGDRATIAILAAMADGQTTDAELAEATGLNPHAIESAKLRIRRTARSASPDLLAEIHAALGISTKRPTRRRKTQAPAANSSSTPAKRIARVRRVAAARRATAEVAAPGETYRAVSRKR